MDLQTVYRIYGELSEKLEALEAGKDTLTGAEAAEWIKTEAHMSRILYHLDRAGILR